METGRTTLQEKITEFGTAIVEMSTSARTKGEEVELLAKDISQTMPGVSRWNEILELRLKWLGSVLYSVDLVKGNEHDSTWDSDKEYSLIVQSQNSLHVLLCAMTARTVLGSSNVHLLADNDLMQIVEITKGALFPESWVETLFMKHGWASDHFRVNPVVAKLVDEIEILRIVRVACLRHDAFVDRMKKNQSTMPIEDPGRLIPICALAYLEASAGVARTEHEVKKVQGLFEAARDAMKELNKQVIDGTKQVKAYIEKQRQGAINDKAKKTGKE